MHISKVYIRNFKGIKELTLELKEKVNIIVGKNDSGKSTIVEAINLALSGYYRGRKLDISENLFNKEIVKEYVSSFQEGATRIAPPKIAIELYFGNAEAELNELKGSINHLREDAIGFTFEITFDENYKREYEEFTKSHTISGIPIEYYKFTRLGFNEGDSLSVRGTNYRSVIIDNAYSNMADNYSKKIIEDYFDDSSKLIMTQEQRKMLEGIESNDSFKAVNKKILEDEKFKEKNIKLSLEKTSKTSWETLLTTEVNEIPFENIGRGEQGIVRTYLTLSNPKIKNKNIILMEEPESHLSFSKLYKLIDTIVSATDGHQIIITTHNSFVLNKLGLDSSILINRTISIENSTANVCSRLTDLSEDTIDFFRKRSGYDTLRLLLADKVFLVEGDSDDLVVQRAFLDKFSTAENQILPIDKGIDIITVSLSFLRFLELASKLSIKVAVITDNDGNIEAIKKKYENYLGDKQSETIKVFFSESIVNDESISKDKVPNQNTLEPCIVRENKIDDLKIVIDSKLTKQEEFMDNMVQNKTDSALKIFKSDTKLKMPKYIEDAITWLTTEN